MIWLAALPCMLVAVVLLVEVGSRGEQVADALRWLGGRILG